MFAAENDIHVFYDHRNLLFVYNPTAIYPWAIHLSWFMFTIEHIEENATLWPTS